MNFLEAAKSGKLFRNKKWSYDCFVKIVGDTFELVSPDGRPQKSKLVDILEASQFLTDEWEIQEPTATITRTQFFEAVRDAMVESEIANGRKIEIYTTAGPRSLRAADLMTYPVALIAEKLGLVEK